MGKLDAPITWSTNPKIHTASVPTCFQENPQSTFPLKRGGGILFGSQNRPPGEYFIWGVTKITSNIELDIHFCETHKNTQGCWGPLSALKFQCNIHQNCLV